MSKFKNLFKIRSVVMAGILWGILGVSIVYAGVGIINGNTQQFMSQVTNINLTGLNWNIDQFGTLAIKGQNWTYAKMIDASYGSHSGINWQSFGT